MWCKVRYNGFVGKELRRLKMSFVGVSLGFSQLLRILLAVIFAVTSPLYANADISASESLAPQVPVTPYSGNTAPSTDVNSTIPTAGQAVNRGNRSNGGTNTMGMVLQVGGGILFAACLAASITLDPYCFNAAKQYPAYIGMAVGAAAVALGTMMQNGSKQSDTAIQNDVATPLGIGAVTNPGGSTANSTAGTTSAVTPTINGVPVTAANAAKAVENLAKAGVKIDPKTGNVTMPDGSTINPQSTLSGGKSGSSNVPASDLAAGLKALADGAVAAINGAEASSSTGGDMPSSGSAAAKKAIANAALTQDFTMRSGATKNAAQRTTASVTGTKILTKSGEPIAVAAENLFSLIHNRVTSMVTQDQLLSPESVTNTNGLTAP